MNTRQIRKPGASQLRLLRRFGRDRRGATLIEFGLLALPFFALIAAILETALLFLASQVLDSAVQDASRMVRTGQAQAQSFTAETFRDEICDGLYGLFDCSGLQIRVTPVGSFGATSLPDPLDEDGDWAITSNFNPGAQSDVVLVEAYYKWPVLVDLLGFNLAGPHGNVRLLGSARVFRNEPFGVTG